MKETVIIKPAPINKVQLKTIFNLIEQSLGLTLSVKGRRAARKDIDRYLLRNGNDINKTILFFQDYKYRLKTLYIGYSEEAFNNVINQLYR